MEKEVKKARASKKYDIILIIALFVYIMIDNFIMPKGDTVSVWYHIFNCGWYVICAIFAFLDGKSAAYNTNIAIEKKFQNEEELKEYHESSMFGKKNNTKILIFLILSIIFIGLTVVFAIIDGGKTMEIIGIVCEFVAIIAVILFALCLGEKSGALKALKTKLK